MKFSVASRILPLASLLISMHCVALAASNDQYILSIGDVLSIKQPDGTVTQAPVLPDGTAVINYAGVVDAAGKTIDDVRDIVKEKAKKWFESPNIEITLERKRVMQVYVLGAVEHPGVYSPESMKLSEAQNINSIRRENFTVSGALELAGGLTDTADLRHIHVTRLRPKLVITMSLWKLMFEGNISEDLSLEPGDVVYVPKAGTGSGSTNNGLSSSSNHIRVMGAVNKPGFVDASAGDLDILTVIARCGGFSDEASHVVNVGHCSENGLLSRKRIAVRRGQNITERLIKPGDIVMVKSKKRPAETSDDHSLPKLPGLPANVPIGDFGGLP